jgi:phage gpG-like protein
MASFSLTVSHDTLTPVLHRLQTLDGAGKTAVLRSGGNALLSLTVGNFNSVGAMFRPLPWPAKRDGSPSILQQTTALAHSITLRVGTDTATVSTDRQYAAIHQFGGVIRPKVATALRFFSGGRWWTVQSVTMPARPFFPMNAQGQLTDAAATLITRAMGRAILRVAGGASAV